MANFWPKDFWPPSSPDLNPLDFFWWSVIESRTNTTPHVMWNHLSLQYPWNGRSTQRRISEGPVPLSGAASRPASWLM
ncbi:Transposable element tcb1 transposase [Caligus rogercresseyi]|uniref:Transposable element tcb1 transposase n=1 Tax=Caligus rogercresseyi TaxID=217165 RepID=A0A7T8KLH4_CALRO|nr:Transposable element tcb1 transposase [Caligus rogercresseyi]